MSKTAKFAVSMPEAEFKDIEAERRRAKKTRSEFIREAVRAWQSREGRAGAASAPRAAVKEDARRYELLKAAPETLADTAELRRRAIAAAGSFQSGSSDLSVNHDKHLAEEYAVTGAAAAIEDKIKSGAKP
jgi:Arc/MetJ-type ribon-helix-helix transcriptional regulator